MQNTSDLPLIQGFLDTFAGSKMNVQSLEQVW